MAGNGAGGLKGSRPVDRIHSISQRLRAAVGLERSFFAVALWGKTDNDTQPLPADTQLLTSTVAKLPAPPGIDQIARVKARIFDRDLRDVMDCAGPTDTRILSEKQNHLISLYNTAPLDLSMPAERAAGLFDQVVAWNPAPLGDNHPLGVRFKEAFNDFVRRQASDALTFAVVPAMTREDRNEARLRTLLDFINRTKSWPAVAALPDFLETAPAMKESVVLAIHRGLSAAEHLRISGAATGLIRWSRLIQSHALTNIPRRLIEQVLSMIETRQEEGLHVLLNAAIALIKDRMLTDEDMARLTHTLSDLREEAKYSSILLDSRRAVSISLVRQQCVRLAHLLKQRISDDGTLDGWLEEGRSDPLPEVRFSAQTA